jgi:hypothetical protein
MRTEQSANLFWDRIRYPNGPVSRALKRAGTSAPGIYAAYLAHGVRHPSLLRPSASALERAEPLPGDELVERPDWVTDFAVDVAAPAAEVWPWIVQLGYGRAGWYTWFPLDNGGIPSADAIVPALQGLAVGDAIPDGPRAAEGFGVWRVHAIDRPRALVLRSRRNLVTGHEVEPGGEGREPFVDCSWVFALAEPSPGHTRLRVRVRARFLGPRRWTRPVARAARILFGLGDSVMENSMLAGIRARAERRARAA